MQGTPDIEECAHDVSWHRINKDEAIQIAEKLLAWFDANARIMPWRVADTAKGAASDITTLRMHLSD
jgi:hypothetical protein